MLINAMIVPPQPHVDNVYLVLPLIPKAPAQLVKLIVITVKTLKIVQSVRLATSLMHLVNVRSVIRHAVLVQLTVLIVFLVLLLDFYLEMPVSFVMKMLMIVLPVKRQILVLSVSDVQLPSTSKIRKNACLVLRVVLTVRSLITAIPVKLGTIFPRVNVSLALKKVV